ncbi:hypothetical protein ACIPPR_34475 [Streptomyces nigra]|uniref:hypothetical protein n=1 Tax=Streptomyces nigra TaxID=1827580 RepID=UPI003818F747
MRDAHTHQLRAVLEPDLTDYARDRRADDALLGTAPVLDEARAAHLAQAREAVRAYTAAAHSGRDAGNPRRRIPRVGARWPAVPNSGRSSHW